MSNELIINASLPEIRIALMEEGEIQELLIERASDKGIVGNIYKGRVTRVLPGMQAAFVDIGLEKAAFLYVDDVYVHSNEMPREMRDDLDEAEDEDRQETSAAMADSEGDSQEAPSAEGSQSEFESQNQESEQNIESDLDSESESRDDENRASEDDTSEMDPLPDDEDESPMEMGLPPGDDDSEGGDEPVEGTIAASEADSPAEGTGDKNGPAKRRGRRGGRRKRGGRNEPKVAGEPAPGGGAIITEPEYPENLQEQMLDSGDLQTDRSAIESQDADEVSTGGDADSGFSGRPEPKVIIGGGVGHSSTRAPARKNAGRNEFQQKRGRDRRVRPKMSTRPMRGQAKIEELLKEGQEVLVQVAKDPIATKGARLTCHISLAGRHLVCMPTIDHIGVSRRIERDDERRRLREYVDRHRPRGMGFIVRTASGSRDAEKWIQTDVEYLTHFWRDIQEKAAAVSAPAIVHEDLNPALRAVRDWVSEDINKIMVDSRYYFNEIKNFVSRFMPILNNRVELYQGDIPIFDAYGISTELHRALERRVWLKSGGYIVIDQAEALVAIDVNTGRFVGKRNLEDTILKTNLEAVEEVAYQLRLRNCGGIIIIDLIDMEKEENRRRVYRALEAALQKDRARPTIIKMSELGLIEMTRKRTRDTMVRALCEPCVHCEGKGFVKSKETVTYEVLREIEREGIERDVRKVLVQAHPDVIDLLAIDHRETLDLLERRYKKQIYLQPVLDYHLEQFDIVSERDERKKDSQPFRRSGAQNNRPQRSNWSRGDRSSAPEGRPAEAVVSSSAEPARVIINPIRINSQPVIKLAPNAGNGVSKAPDGDDQENIGNREPGVQDLSESTFSNAGDEPGRTEPGNRAPSADHFEDEEDRLAFLRAQATQDAALAKMNASAAIGAPSMRPGKPHRPGGGQGRNNNNNNRNGGRGRRGGRGGPMRNAGNNNSRRFEPRSPQGGVGGGRIIPDRGEVNPAPITITSDSGSDNSGNDSDSGHSNPPPHIG